MSYYGSPRAVCTPYGDLYFCLACALYIHEHKTEKDEIYKFVRELDKSEIELGSKYQLTPEQKDFATLVAQGKVKSWLGSKSPMKLLHEGMANEQSIIDAQVCNCCGKALRDFCVDY